MICDSIVEEKEEEEEEEEETDSDEETRDRLWEQLSNYKAYHPNDVWNALVECRDSCLDSVDWVIKFLTCFLHLLQHWKVSQLKRCSFGYTLGIIADEVIRNVKGSKSRTKIMFKLFKQCIVKVSVLLNLNFRELSRDQLWGPYGPDKLMLPRWWIRRYFDEEEQEEEIQYDKNQQLQSEKLARKSACYQVSVDFITKIFTSVLYREPISSFNKDDQRLFKKTTTHFERNEHAAFGEYSRINFDKRLDSECLSLSDLTNGNHGCDSDNEEEDYFGGEEYYGEGEHFGEGEGEYCDYS